MALWSGKHPERFLRAQSQGGLAWEGMAQEVSPSSLAAAASWPVGAPALGREGVPGLVPMPASQRGGSNPTLPAFTDLRVSQRVGVLEANPLPFTRDQTRLRS